MAAIFVVRKEMMFLRPFCVKVIRTPEMIDVEYVRRHVINGKVEDFYIYGYRLELEKLRKRVDWKDCTQYGIHFKDYDCSYMQTRSDFIDECVASGMRAEDIRVAAEQAYPRYGTVNRNGYLFNISSFLQNGRVTSLEGHALFAAHRMLNFTIKFKDSTFDKIMVSMNIDPACGFEINEGNEVIEVINSMEIYRKLRKEREDIKDLVWRPKLKMSFSNKNRFRFPELTYHQLKSMVDDLGDPIPDTAQILPDSCVTISMQLVREWDMTPYQHAAEVYLEAVNGYLPKNRIMLDENGHATFKAMSLGLEPGDTMRIKAGFRYNTGIADFTLHVRGYDTTSLKSEANARYLGFAKDLD